MDQEQKSKTKWIWEFSKRLVLLLSVAYFAVVVYAAAAMAATGCMDALGVLIENNAEILKVCVFGYFVKAGVENALKITKNNNDTPDEEGDSDE
jgi:hypothetical protein